MNIASKQSRKLPSGGLAVFIILGVVFMGSLVMIGGLLPSERKPPPPNYQTGELATSPGSSSEPGLQLKTLKFKNITPTPTPTVTSAPIPSATPIPCKNSLTVDFLLDITGSMTSFTPSGFTKVSRLKEAVLAMTQNLTDDSIIGIQAFNSRIISRPDIMDVIPIAYFRDVKRNIPSEINLLVAEGGTPTRNALVFSYNKLAEAIPRFPGRKFNFILISDGAPCPGAGCPGNSGANQDPRLFTPNPADQIKNLGVTVYTVGVYDAAQAEDPRLSDLLKSIASSPSNYYHARSADEIQSLLTAITGTICK
ncbi:MAG: vWA domain-containing protein [Patescibacteria group bacterium]